MRWIVLRQLRSMLADCYWFQRLLDPANPWDRATALGRIHIDALPRHPANESYTKDELLALRPYAIIEQASFQMDFNYADSCCERPKGMASIGFRVSTPDAMVDDEFALAEYMTKTLDSILRTKDDAKPGLLDLRGSDADGNSRLQIRRVSQDVTYSRIPREKRTELGDYCVCDFDIGWGQM